MAPASLTVRPLRAHSNLVMNTSERSNQAIRLTSTRSEGSREGQEMVRELEKALARTYRFTRSERLILRELVAGASVESIARGLELRTTSIHKHMHRIFAKTRTEGRQALLKLGMRLAARRRIFAPCLLAA